MEASFLLTSNVLTCFNINLLFSSAVTIDVNPVNDPPLANGDSATTDEDTLVNIAVLLNDSDPDLDTLNTTVIVSGPSNGVATLKADGTVDYAPTADFNGQDSFVYRISDGNGGTSTATGRFRSNGSCLPEDHPDMLTTLTLFWPFPL